MVMRDQELLLAFFILPHRRHLCVDNRQRNLVCLTIRIKKHIGFLADALVFFSGGGGI